MDVGEPIPGTAPQEVGQKIEPASRKISRRRFLRLAGTALARLALKSVIGATADIWQPKVVDLGIDTLENPAAVESVIASSASSLEILALRDRRAIGAPEITTNPAYRPMTEIIGGVLDQWRKEAKSISYQRVNGYENLPYYLDKLRRAAHDPVNRDKSPIESGKLPASSYVLGYNPGIVEQVISSNSGFFPKDVRAVYELGSISFLFSFQLTQKGSGFLDRTIEVLGEESRKISNTRIDPGGLGITTGEEHYQAVGYWQKHQDEIDQVVKKYLQDIAQHTEMCVSQTGTPVSAGVIFSYCMDRNNGSIDKSLTDAMIFLKYMARNDITLHTLDPFKNDADSRRSEAWFKRNIEDEYGKVGYYSELPHETYPYSGSLSIRPGLADLEVDKDLHLLNQIGKPYHAWNIVSMLAAIPPTLTQIGVARRQLDTFTEQGPIKTASDFRVALELDKLDLLFSQV